MAKETQFNRYLLEELAARTYADFVALITEWKEEHQTQLWPLPHDSNSATRQDEIQSLVAAFYRKIMDTSRPRRVLQTIKTGSHPQKLGTLKEAVICRNPSIRSIIKALDIPNIYEYPVIPTLPEDLVNGWKFLDGHFLREYLQSPSVDLSTLLDSRHQLRRPFDDLIMFIVENAGVKGLHSLEVLPTQNGTVRAARPRGSETLFVPSPFERTLFAFAGDRLVKLEDETINTLLHPDNDINMASLKKTDVAELISSVLPADDKIISRAEMSGLLSPTLDLLGIGVEEWIDRFWNYVHGHDVPIETLCHLPLIPLSHPEGKFISIMASKDSLGIQALSFPEPVNRAIYSLEGIHVPSYRILMLQIRLLESPPMMSLEVFDKWLAQSRHGWDFLDGQTKLTLSEWIRSEVEKSPPKGPSSLQNIAKLPIWPSSVNSAARLRPSELVVVTTALSKCRPFLRGEIYFADGSISSALETFGATVLKRPEGLYSYLTNLQHHVHQDNDAYFTLLAYLSQAQSSPPSPTLPNQNMRLCHPNELFSPVVDIYSAALPSEKLLNQRIIHMVPHLKNWGLNVDVNESTFLECARAIHYLPSDQTKVERATKVYQRLNEDTDLRATWDALTNLSFIPRDDLLNSTRTWRTQSHLDIDPVARPSQVVRPALFNIAWSQRASFRVDPTYSLLQRWEDLGVPTVEEVIKHLIFLSAMDPARLDGNPTWKSEFIGDLEEIYGFLSLEKNKSSTKQALKDRSQPIFLNIDSAAVSMVMQWNWRSATQLVLGLPSDIPAKNRYQVRRFLSKHEELLTTAGVRELTSDPYNASRTLEKSSSYPDQVIEGFATLWKEDKLTDVKLKSTEGDEYPAHKAFLASTNEYFKAKFSSGLADSGQMDVSSRTLRKILDYFYGIEQELIPPPDDDNGDHMTQMLDLLVGCDKCLITELHHKVEDFIGTNFVRPDTVIHIKRVAEDANAENLLKHCVELIKKMKDQGFEELIPDEDE